MPGAATETAAIFVRGKGRARTRRRYAWRVRNVEIESGGFAVRRRGSSM